AGADAVAHVAVPVRRRAGGPAPQVDAGSPPQLRLVDVDVAIPPATQQAGFPRDVLAIEAEIDLRADLVVVDPDRRNHEAVELVVLVAQPAAERVVGDGETRDRMGVV